MKKSRRRFAGNGLLLFLPAIAFASVGASAQSTALEQPPQPLLASDVVKPCGTYSKTGILVQSSSAISNDNNCPTIVSQNADVHFTARNKIILLPGFTAYEGSKFLADINSITSNNQVVQAGSVDEDMNKNLRVLPNPFKTSFAIFISVATDCKAQLTLTNAVGAKAKEQKDIALSKGMNKIVFDASGLAPGMYILEANYGDAKTIKKIVKSE